jgi:hypothetical protein
MAAYDSPGFVSHLPGVTMDAHDNAMTASGSNPSRSSSDAVALSGQSGIPGVGTVTPLAGQADPGSAGVNQPGQNDASVIAPGPAQGYTSTGAGQGHNIASDRYEWQQKPQGG